MKSKVKKIRKQRGHRTHGWGSPKKHRGAGSRGGRGYAGSKKHKKVWVAKNDPERLGKRGFHSLRDKKVSPRIRAINLRDLEKIALKKGLKEINLKALGYDKLLGTGQVTRKLIVKADMFSASAKEKLEKAGGKLIKI
jgi:large subunit ribosomal protein L15